MKVNIRSIGFRLLFLGLCSVLLPLALVGFISITRSSEALTKLSEEMVKTMAQDSANLVNNILLAEKRMASTFSSAQTIIKHVSLINQNGAENEQEAVKAIHENLKKKFDQMGDSYQGIFVADSKGNVITGILEGGSEYKAISIAENDEFKKAVQSQSEVVGEMIISKASGKPIIPIMSPIKSDDGVLIGAYGSVLKADLFTNLVSGRKVGETGYGYMLNSKGVVLAHPKKEHVLTLDASSIPEMRDIVNQMLGGKTGVEDYVFKGVEKIAGFAPVGINGWSISVTQDKNDFLKASVNIRNMTLIVVVSAMVIVGIIIVFSSRSIVRPINGAVEGLKDIAQGEGDLTMRLPVTSQDEVGELATWFNIFMEKLQGIIKDISGGVQTLASSSTELSVISTQMNKGIRTVSDKSSAVASASEEMSTSMNNVAAAMEQSAANTNMLATASEEMSSTINEIARNAEKARDISNQASKKAATATDNIDQLGVAAKSIGKVIETITDISEQVNLLALNATIEAARAGEAGKGFAVVANEIKELARQTADATQDIREKVEGIQGTTSVTVKEITEITGVIAEVNEVVTTIAAAVEEQSAATTEIAGNVAQVSTGIQEVNVNVNQSSSAVSEISRDIADVNGSMAEMSNSSSQVDMSARELSKLSEQLKAMVEQFKV